MCAVVASLTFCAAIYGIMRIVRAAWKRKTEGYGLGVSRGFTITPMVGATAEQILKVGAEG